MTKTARLIVMMLLLGGVMPVSAKLGGPSIRSVEIKPADPDQIRISLGGLSCPAGISTNGGLTFAPASEREAGAGWVTNLSVGSRRYAWASSSSEVLFKSDDGGDTVVIGAHLCFVFVGHLAE
jgi:hypothetical protein